MVAETQLEVSAATANAVENLAYQVAARQEGRILPVQLAPYLPMSLRLIRACLDNMVDEQAVLRDEVDGLPGYRFTTGPGAAGEATGLTECVSCKDGSRLDEIPLCPACLSRLNQELAKLADQNGWPAEAVYEHEILFLGAEAEHPLEASELAARSRYTLKQMRQKLKNLTLAEFIRQDLDEERGAVVCHLPPLTYSRAAFERNRQTIRRHPASLREEVELRLVRILLALAALLAGLFLLRFIAPLPPVLLILLFLVLAPGVAIWIWRRHRDLPRDDEE